MGFPSSFLNLSLCVSLSFSAISFGCFKRKNTDLVYLKSNYTCSSEWDSKAIIGDTTLKWFPIPYAGFSKPYENHNYWLHFQVQVPKPGVHFLINDYTMLEHFRVYLVDSAGTMVYLGDQGFRSAASANRFSFPVFELNLDKGIYDIYIHEYKRFSTSNQQISVLSNADFSTFLSSYQFWNGAVYAIIILLFVQGLISFAFFNLKKYLLYSLYVFSLFLIFFIAEGSYKLYFPLSWHSSIYFLLYYSIVLCIAFLFILFTELLPVHNTFPKLRKWGYFLFFVSLLNVGFHHYAFQYLNAYPVWAFKISNLGLFLLPSLLFSLSLYFYFKYKHRQAFWLLVVFGLTLLFVLSFALLPFLGIQHAYFMQFKWIVLFEALAVFVVLYKDFFYVLTERNRLELTLQSERHASSLAFISGIAKERQLIFSKFHDELALNISLIEMDVERISQRNGPSTKHILAQLSKLQKDLRLISQGVFPYEIESIGLFSAMEHKIQHIEDHFPDLIVIPEISRPSISMNKDVELLFYLTFNELIQNSLKHSFATEIRISFYSSNEHLILEVEDNGVGYDLSIKAAGQGLEGIKRRSFLASGYFSVINKNPGSLSVFGLPVSFVER
jgi:signal transduction histidine kinase